MIILGTNSIKATGFDVANSCRFNGGDSAKFNIDHSGAGNRVKWTLSMWVKRSNLGAEEPLFNARPDSNFETFCGFGANDTLVFKQKNDGSTSGEYVTNRVFRDVSAWYNFIFVYDKDNSTAGDRGIIYVNGVRETSFSTSSNFSDLSTWNSTNTNNIGNSQSAYFDGYMSEIVFVDGQALSATSFGEFDEDSEIWKPIDVSGLTPGTNGFYLDFEDSSNLGNNAFNSGSADWTETNITATDQSSDSCTNNFATMNPLDNYYPASTFSEGNLKIVSGSSPYSSNTATFGLSSGKWYYELKYLARGGSEDLWHVGIKSTQDTANDQMLGHFANDYGYRAYNGKVRNNNGDITYGNTWTINDIIGVYIDLDNSKLYFAKNGTVQNSGTGISITAVASTPLGVYLPAISWNDGSTTGTCSLNFGSPMDDTGGNTDANGYGNFEYDPSAGTFDSASKDFFAICTKNLAEYG